MLVACGTLARPSSVTSPARSPASSDAPDTPLKQVQAEFRPGYEAARERIASSLSPLIVSRLGDLFLFRDGMPTLQGKGIPPKHLRLHRTAHAPFFLYLKLEPQFGQASSSASREDLVSYKALLDAAPRHLGTANSLSLNRRGSGPC